MTNKIIKTIIQVLSYICIFILMTSPVIIFVIELFTDIQVIIYIKMLISVLMFLIGLTYCWKIVDVIDGEE